MTARLAALLCALVLLGACTQDEPETVVAASPSPSPTPEKVERVVCPLSGRPARDEALAERPALAVKVENNPVAYPLSGLEDAEIVYEELVEGGLTRFMALYHCTDSAKVGPVRSARAVDPAIMTPTTRILADAGANDLVKKELDESNIFSINEDRAGKAMRRVDRAGITAEHTLYGDTRALRKIGQKRFDKPPPSDTFSFGPPARGSIPVRGVTIHFSAATEVSYRWSKGAWVRYDDGDPLPLEGAPKVTVDNVIIEEHTVDYSDIVDVAGNNSTEIADVTGSGPAVLLRDGRAYRGRWKRKSVKSPVAFVTKGGDPMTLKPGVTWIELVPNNKGDLKGSYELHRKTNKKKKKKG